MKKKILILNIILCLLLIIAGCNKPEDIPDDTEITISRTALNLVVGESATLTISNTTETVTWSSSNENIATVSQSGVVLGISEGTAHITAIVGTENLTCKVDVTETPVGVPSLTIDKSSSTINRGYTLTLRPHIRVGHDFINMEEVTVNWQSDNQAVATVNSQGVVTGITNGNVKITASCMYDGQTLTASCNLTVIKAVVYKFYVDDVEIEPTESIKVIAADSYIGTTDTSSALVKIKEVDAESGEGVFINDGITWNCDNEDVATVDGNGIVTGGTENGSAVITANLNGEDIAQATVESWTLITTKAHLDELALATWKLYNDVPKMERVLAGKYILGNDIDYNGQYILPIANARLTPLLGVSQISSQSYTWRSILEPITPDWDDWNFGVNEGEKESTFKGSNPLQKPFTGILDGNGYSIINAQLIYDNYFTRNEYVTPYVFFASGAQFLGLNSGVLRNISFENVSFSKNLGTLYDGATLVADWSKYSYAFAKSHFTTDANGLVYQNNTSGVVENVFISLKIKTTWQLFKPSSICVRENNGTVKNVVVVHEAGKLPSPTSDTLTDSGLSGVCALRHLVASNTGTFTDSFVLMKAPGFEHVTIGEVGANCTKFDSLSGAGANSLATKVGSGAYSLTSFDTDIWDIDYENGDGLFALKKGNYWSLSQQ